jgi:light-regulated signal transduction histidine kinase (bacteriophytochrome)
MQPQPAELPRECFVPLYVDSLHDLASPANQISTLFELFRRRQGQPVSGDEEALLDMIQVSTNRLQKLMAALRDYARVTGSPREFRSCDSNALFTSAVNSLDALIRESGAQVTHDALPQIQCDPNRLIYAFMGLIENAIKFRGEAPAEIRISAADQGGHWLFSVQDNGMGIDPRYRESIFHMFKRIHGDHSTGAGAGLAIVQRVIQQHDGRIWIESEPGRGSTFFFTIPKA